MSHIVPEGEFDPEIRKENAPSAKIQEHFREWVIQTKNQDNQPPNFRTIVAPERLLIAKIKETPIHHDTLQKTYYSFKPPSNEVSTSTFSESASLAIFREPDKTEIELLQSDESGGNTFVLYEDNNDPSETHLSVFNNFGTHTRKDFNYLSYNKDGVLETVNVETHSSDESLYAIGVEQLNELAKSGELTVEIEDQIVQLVDEGLTITLVHDNKNKESIVRTTTTIPKTIDIKGFIQTLGIDEQLRLSPSEFVSADDSKWRKVNIPRTLGIVTKVEFPE